MGRRPIVLAQTSVEEGIKACRMLFPRCYFDSDKTTRLVECLKRYRRAIHAQTGEPMGPLHDEYSHGADCFRYIGQSVEIMPSAVGASDYTAREPPDWRL
jgi:phage terminase large subunit